jgi:hypothetical protein
VIDPFLKNLLTPKNNRVYWRKVEWGQTTQGLGNCPQHVPTQLENEPKSSLRTRKDPGRKWVLKTPFLCRVTEAKVVGTDWEKPEVSTFIPEPVTTQDKRGKVGEQLQEGSESPDVLAAGFW